MEIKIDNPQKVLMKSLEDAFGLTAYAKTLQLDKISESEYQKNFTSYYRVRRDSEWLKKYYEFMRLKVNSNVTFQEILTELSSWKHKVKITDTNPSGYAEAIEVSFSSKLLATINTNYPIWDSQVVKALNIDVDIKENDSKAIKINKFVLAYTTLKTLIEEYINSEDGKKAIKLFDKQFPNYKNISSIKKIDFYLWNIGKN
ncbi:MAG: hypothetical protein IJW82_04970 [Clostridia bacterium]|nr:hypothetical protein [Clostridia bacterium]